MRTVIVTKTKKMTDDQWEAYLLELAKFVPGPKLDILRSTGLLIHEPLTKRDSVLERTRYEWKKSKDIPKDNK